MEEAEPTKPSRRNLYIIITVVVITALAVSSILYWNYQMHRARQIKWLFKGAYGYYVGSSDVGGPEMIWTMRLEIMDYTATHGKLQMHMEIKFPEYPEYNEESDHTVSFDLFEERYEIQGATLLSTKEKAIYFENFGVRQCVIFTYKNPEMVTDYYVDVETNWIMRTTLSMDYPGIGPMMMTLELDETNIPELL